MRLGHEKTFRKKEIRTNVLSDRSVQRQNQNVQSLAIRRPERIMRKIANHNNLLLKVLHCYSRYTYFKNYNKTVQIVANRSTYRWAHVHIYIYTEYSQNNIIVCVYKFIAADQTHAIDFRVRSNATVL